MPLPRFLTNTGKIMNDNNWAIFCVAIGLVVFVTIDVVSDVKVDGHLSDVRKAASYNSSDIASLEVEVESRFAAIEAKCEENACKCDGCKCEGCECPDVNPPPAPVEVKVEQFEPVQVQSQPTCVGGNCGTRSTSRTYRRRGLFGWRR